MVAKAAVDTQAFEGFRMEYHNETMTRRTQSQLRSLGVSDWEFRKVHSISLNGKDRLDE